MSAEKLFEEMKAFVDAACKAKDHLIAVLAAERLGFQNISTADSISQILASLRYCESSGNEVWLVAKWHDPSGPFQNIPDINRIRLTLTTPGGAPVEYMNEYEG